MTTAKKEDKVENVEMKEETEKLEEKKDPDLLSVEDIREHCKLIRKSVETKEPRYDTELQSKFAIYTVCLGLCCAC